LPPPPEPNPQMQDLFKKGGTLALLQVGRQVCKDRFPIIQLNP
jgi:hypothetical protein